MHPDLAALISTEPRRLGYSVHSASGYVPPFPPEKICIDCPSDDNSRWTTPTPDARKKERQQYDKSWAAGTVSSNQTVGQRDRLAKAPLEQGESEWIMIELDSVSLVQSIGFGKGAKAHPCNLAEFSIYAGMSPSPSSMEKLLDGSLKNDSNTQKFGLHLGVGREGKELAPLPVKYIKVECHEAVNVTYSIAIWHLFLEGYILTPPLDTIAIDALSHHEEATTAHLILSHLRRSSAQTLPAFEAYLATLPASISSTFEHPLLTKLHKALVLEGDFDKAERVLEECLRDNLFREWSPSSTGRKKGTTIAKWDRLDNAFPSGAAKPGPRGGHQMVRVGRKLLLFGGWDGKQDLGDLWEWELPRDDGAVTTATAGEAGWRRIASGDEGTRDTRPGKRSCHQLAVDESEGWVYLLGARRDDDVPEDWDHERNGSDAMEIEGDGVRRASATADSRGLPHEDRWRSDFWRYKAVGPGKGQWELLSHDTSNDGGPALLFDHAMVVHASTQRLFVFGGKWQPYEGGDAQESNGTPATSAPTSQYSGMYCYDISAKKWTHLFGDPTSQTTPASFLMERLVPRAGHSMVLDASGRNATIYVYGGQRDTRYENDLWAVRLATPRSSDDNAEDYDDDLPEVADDEDRLWRQGAVLDAPRRAIARSLIDASLLPVSPESSPSRSSSLPTILQIRRLDHRRVASSVTPPAAFTPRLSLTANRSLTLLTGLTRTGSGSAMQEVPLEGIWRKSGAETSPWEKIEEWSAGSSRSEERRPVSRFASQVVYDPLRNEHYVFGGHPLNAANPDTRLADFWKLRIIDPTPEEALRMSKFLVRKQRFNEMCTSVPTVIALQYLQNDLSAVVDHSSPSESTAFRSCMTALLSAPPEHNVDVPLDGSGELPALEHGGKNAQDEAYRARHKLFEELMAFFPLGERQPIEQLGQFSRMLRSKGSVAWTNKLN